MIIDGTAYWANIKTPNTTFEPMYTVNLVVDEATANDLRHVDTPLSRWMKVLLS
jgi:hypothetical protein